MEDYYEYLDSNGVTTLYKLIKDDTVALIDSYSVTINGITTNLDNHVNNADIHTPIATIEGMIDTAVGSLNYATPDYVDTKVADLVNSAPGTLDTLKELSDALGNDSNFATTVVNQIGTKADKDSVYTKLETDTLLEGKANSVHTHVVSDITDFPTIPTKLSQLENDMGFGTGGGSTDITISWTNITDKPTIPTKTSDLTNDSGYITGVAWGDITSKPSFSDVAISGSYNDLVDTPTIPTKTSNLTNDSGYITSVSWNDVTSKPVLSQVAISGSYSDLSGTPTIPTKTSQLINDSGFLTSSSGLITSVSWSDITNKPNLSTVATSGSYNDLSNKPTIPSVYNKTLTIQKNGTNVATFTSNSNTDVTADITVPTKVSELSNDSGFITGISWDKVTNKPTLATVATSGSYTDLSNTPTIPTKVSQLENDMGFGTGGDTSDCVHKTGNETIEGTKKFTDDLARKNTAVDITTTPTSDMYAHINFTDKNDKSVAYIQYAQKSNGVDYIGLRVRDKNSNTWGVQLNTNKEFVPLGNNSYSLGSPNNKWAKVYSDDVVHTSGDETITGNKTFSNQMYLGGGGTSYGLISAKDNNSILRLFGGTSPSTGANLDLYGENLSSGGFSLRARTSDKIVGLDGKTDGTLKWNGKNVALDENLVHRSGNELITGAKIFTNTIYRKNTSTDLTVTPTSTQFSRLVDLADKNDKTLGYIEHAQRSGGNDLTLYVTDKNSGVHGVRLNEHNTFFPIENNVYSLGASGAKWANVYATTFNGNSVMCTGGNAFMAQNGGYTFLIRNDDSNTYFLMSDKDGVPGTWSTARPLIINNSTGVCSINGHADSANYADVATYATTQATSDNSTKIATTAWVRTYVNSVVGSGSVGASISAYYSNATTLTAEGNSSSSGGSYPSDYSDYINISPTVGTIYTGSQLFGTLNASASGSTHSYSPGSTVYHTTAKATATFSGAFSASAKYLCTTANAVKFRAFVSQGTPSAMGSPSVVDNSSAKSIFIRVQ